jgi:ATP-dependent Clp protease ATP-binding subunit ClpA
MMGQHLEAIINKAIRRANQLRHEYLTLENLLLSLLEDEQVVQVIKDCNGDIDVMQKELEEFLNNAENFSILTQEQIEALSRRQFVDEELRNLARQNGVIYQPEISLALQRVIQRAALHVQSAGKNTIKAINILVAMFQEKESFALYVLQKQGIGRLQVVQAVAHDVDRPVNAETNPQEEGNQDEEAAGRARPQRQNILEEYTVNLNAQAKEGKIDPLIGREKEVERVVQILCRRRKNNPLLVGDAGVGKTAIAEGLAWAIVNKVTPEVLNNAVVYSLDMASILAGAKFRGDFEQRLKVILKEFGRIKKTGINPIIFIDELHTVMGAGATTGGSMDASNLLKPHLSSGEIRCMGSTTHDEYRKFVEKDSAFNRRFQKVDIDEPSLDETYQILKGLKGKFEEFHDVKIPNNVLQSAVDLSVKHLADRRLPDKAIDVIDEAGALQQLLPAAKRRKTLAVKDIEHVISQMAKIPKKSVASDEREKLRNLRSELASLIFGQDEAVAKVADAILMARSGLNNPDKPLGSFLFAGPTGVGKTELAKQLAFIMGVNFQRFDMSEYMEKHSVAKLIGAPPGYVGYDEGGQLTDAIKKNPYSILLLDEIEKAHPDLFNILLQVMDRGALTDAQGRTTNFKNVILIMTTNAGAKEMESGSIGLGGMNTEQSGLINKRDQVIKNFFSPEFRNRLDAVIHFNRLTHQQVLSIVDKFLAQLDHKLSLKGVELEVEAPLKDWFAQIGFDPKMGARPLERLITEKLAKPIGQELLFGKLAKGGKVTAALAEDKQSVTLKFA